MKHQHHPVDTEKNRCPRCNKPYDFWTQNGKLAGPAHPVGECRAPRLYIETSRPPRKCSECPNIIGESRPGAATLTCSSTCKAKRDERLRLQKEANRSKAKEKQTLEAKAFYEKYREARIAKKRRKEG